MSTQVACLVSYRVKYVKNVRYNVREDWINYTDYKEAVLYRDYSACYGNKQERQCTYNVTLRRVRATIAEMEKQ